MILTYGEAGVVVLQPALVTPALKSAITTVVLDKHNHAQEPQIVQVVPGVPGDPVMQLVAGAKSTEWIIVDTLIGRIVIATNLGVTVATLMRGQTGVFALMPVTELNTEQMGVILLSTDHVMLELVLVLHRLRKQMSSVTL